MTDWSEILDRISAMKPMTVLSIEHACRKGPGLNCPLKQTVDYGVRERKERVKTFHDGPELYVVKLGE